MRKQLEEKLQRFEELEQLLVDPEVLADPRRLSAVAREHGSLAKVATKYRRFKHLNDQIAEAKEMVEGDDPEHARTGRGRAARAQGASAKGSGTSFWT